MALQEAPFGTYTSVQVASAAAQAEIIAGIDSLKTLIPNNSVAAAPAHPDFCTIPPEAAAKLQAELDALSAAVDAMPTA